MKVNRLKTLICVFLFLFLSAVNVSGNENSSDKIKYDANDLVVVDDTIQLYSYEEMVDDINELTGRYGGALSKEIIGQSLLGKDIYAVTLGRSTAGRHVMVQASIHGREYINTQIVMKLLEYYAYYYDKMQYNDKPYSELFADTAFHVIPMANPDGVTISQFGVSAFDDDKLFGTAYRAYLRDAGFIGKRKNSDGQSEWVSKFSVKKSGKRKKMTFETYQKRWKANARGVDLNRNFDSKWEDTNSRQNPSYSHYKGKTAASEPETKALVDYAQKYDFICYVNYHSMGNIIYYDCKGNTPELSTKEKDFAKRVSSIVKYSIVNTKNSKSVDFGGFGDWVQLSLNKVSITIESGSAACPVPVSEFNNIWNHHRELWAYIANMELQ